MIVFGFNGDIVSDTVKKTDFPDVIGICTWGLLSASLNPAFISSFDYLLKFT